MDPVQLNVEGVKQLVESPINKTHYKPQTGSDGVVGNFEDVLSLDLDDEQLLHMASVWEANYRGYEDKLKQRQKLNEAYYLGRQDESTAMEDKVIPSNLIFEAQETFIPAALAKNPSPVVYPASPNPEGEVIAKNIKTMLQYHADTLVLRRKLALMVRHWSVYFLGAIKHGWDDVVEDISMDVIMPTNLILDPTGTIDSYGNYTGEYLGERKQATAEELIKMFESEYNDLGLSGEKKAYIISEVDGKLGTKIQYTEWWTNEYCFYTFKDIVLDKNKNQFYNYDVTEEPKESVSEYGEVEEPTVLPGRNHFGRPKMPYTFLAVFSSGKQPHDDTSLIEQNIPNQDLVTKRIKQINKNLDVGNNSLAVSADNFNNETAKQAADAIEAGRPIMVPQGKSINEAIQRLPASNLPSDAFNQLQDMTQRLRSIYGTLGISGAGGVEEKTVRGQILNQQQDNSRIGGGIGDALEQVADNIFNWWVQLYYVFYDEPHYASILGKGRALEYIILQSSDITEKVIVSVAPNSMKPHDEITEINQALDLANTGWLDPLSLFERLNDSDPKETAKRVGMWKVNPQQYLATYFPDIMPAMPPGMEQVPDQNIPPDTGESLSANQASPSLSQVPINSSGMPNM